MDKDWPEALPAALLQVVERLVARIPPKSLLTAKDRNREAKRLARNARKLLEDVRAFHAHYPSDVITENWTDAALEAAGGFDLDERESALFRAGFSPYGLQHPLNGLSLHMDAIARPGSGGRPVGWLQRHVVETVAGYFDKAALPVTADPDALLAQTLTVAFERLQWADPDYYLREFIAAHPDNTPHRKK